MLTDEQLRAFGHDGYLVVRDVVAEPLLADLAAEADALITSRPAPEGTVGFHHYFEHPSNLPVAQRALREIVEGYGATPPALEWYLAAAVMRRLDRPLRRLKRRWPERTERILTVVEDLVSR